MAVFSRTSRFINSWWAVFVIGALTAVIVYDRWRTLHPIPVAGTSFVSVGDQLSPSIHLQLVDGRPVDFRWDSDPRPTLVYVVQPHCKWCAINYSSIKKVVANAKEYRIIALSIVDKEAAEYVDKYPLAVPLYTFGDELSKKSLRISATPSTLIVSPEGRVQKVWVGAYGGEMRKSVQAKLGIDLPDLDPGKTLTP